MSHQGSQLPLALAAVHQAQCLVAGYTLWVLKDYTQRFGYNEEYHRSSARGMSASTPPRRRLPGFAIGLTGSALGRPALDAAAEHSDWISRRASQGVHGAG